MKVHARTFPQPAGLIRANSASSQVLEVFKNNNDHWLSQSNLQWLARLSGQQTSWALHYLKTIGLIEHVVLDERNPRSGKYKLVAASQGVTAKVAQQKPSMRDHGTPDGTR